MRLLWAEALNDIETAIVIESHGQLLGGVAIMRQMTIDMRLRGASPFSGGRIQPNMSLDFTFVWYDVVDSAEAFRRSARYRKAIEAQRLLPPPGDNTND